jgi:serine protease DegQ
LTGRRARSFFFIWSFVMRRWWLCLALGTLWLAPAVSAGDKKPAAEPKRALKSYQVPFTLTDTQHVMVRAKINGKGPFNFIIDTGAPMLFVSIPVAKKIGIEGDKKGWTTLDRFEMEGGVVQEKVKCRVETPFQLEGMNALGLAGAELHGIIGYTVLAHYKMEFDFTRDKMKWVQLDFEPPQPQPVKLKDGSGMAGLEMIGSLMKFVSALSGIRPGPPPVPRGFLGFSTTRKDNVVVVQSLVAEGPAAKAGLKTGDVLLQIQDNDIKSSKDVLTRTANIIVGQSVRLGIQRGEEKRDITITAGDGL